jgi:hypothetical protein
LWQGQVAAQSRLQGLNTPTSINTVNTATHSTTGLIWSKGDMVAAGSAGCGKSMMECCFIAFVWHPAHLAGWAPGTASTGRAQLDPHTALHLSVLGRTKSHPYLDPSSCSEAGGRGQQKPWPLTLCKLLPNYTLRLAVMQQVRMVVTSHDCAAADLLFLWLLGDAQLFISSARPSLGSCASCAARLALSPTRKRRDSFKALSGFT